MGDDLNTRVFIAPPTFSKQKGRSSVNWQFSGRERKISSRGTRETFSCGKALLLCKTEETWSEIHPSCGGVNVWERSWRRKFESKQNCWIKIKQWLFPPKRRIVADILWRKFFIHKIFHFECLSFEKFLGNSIKDIKQSSQRFCERKKNFKVFDEVF